MNQRGVSWWGLLYGGNTLGAVFGLFTGRFLFAAVVQHGDRNVCGGGDQRRGGCTKPDNVQPPAGAFGSGRISVCCRGSFAVVGISAGGRLSVDRLPGDRAFRRGLRWVRKWWWTRLMGMLLGSTVYVFSIILAVFLIGIALGSGAGAALSRSVPARAALGWCQVLLAIAIAWTAYMIADSLPYWPINPMLSTSPWQIFQLDMARCLWAILPPAIFWGASFPLALASVASPGEDSGKLVGGIYAANTLARSSARWAVSLGAGSLDRHAGHHAKVILALAAVSALVVLGPYAWERSSAVTASVLTLSLILAGLSGRQCRRDSGRIDRLWKTHRHIGRVEAAVHHRGPQLIGGDHSIWRRRD